MRRNRALALVSVAAATLATLVTSGALPRLMPLEHELGAATAPSSPWCATSAPTGMGEAAAGAVVEQFLRKAVVRTVSACAGPTLAVPRLVPAQYETARPQRVEAWYQLAPRVRNARGYGEYAGFLWVDAPDAPPAAFEFLLELHGDRWLVTQFRRAPGSAEIDVSKLPT